MAQSLMRSIKNTARKAVKNTPLGKLVGHRYPYTLEPEHLCFLVDAIDRTKHINGPILEVGCFMGHTSVFLNRHMDTQGIEKPYIAIDTFTGFVQSDVDHEVAARGKGVVERMLGDAFTGNSKEEVQANMTLNGIKRCELVQADVNTLDFSRFDNIALALIDVDLYLPVKSALQGIYPRMANGGIIVVDDCTKHPLFDGAYEAYEEFVKTNGLPSHVTRTKLGIIEVKR